VLAVWGLAEQLWLAQSPKTLFLHRHGFAAFMNLLALPIAAWLLLKASEPERRWRQLLAPVLVFGACVLAIAASSGRASTLTLVVGIGFLIAMSRELRTSRAVAVLLLTAGCAYGIAQVSFDAPVSTVLNRLSSELSAVTTIPGAAAAGEAVVVSQRLLLWQSGLDLLQNAPWYGLGAGTLWLVFGPYRNVLDDTGGYHLHNDYLEVLVELGWPGLALLILSVFCALRMAWRCSRCKDRSRQVRLEAAGLGGALATVTVHALVSFPFYITSIAVLSGLYMGRLLLLANTASKREVDSRDANHANATPADLLRASHVTRHKHHCLPASKSPGLFKSGAVIRVVCVLFVGWGIAEQARTLWSDTRLSEGKAQRVTGDLLGAERTLNSAYRIGGDDRALVALLDLYGAVLGVLREARVDEQAIVDRARLTADELLALRPNSAHAHAAVGEFYFLAARTGNEPRKKGLMRGRARNHLHHALVLAPRMYPARRLLARLLHDQGHVADAVAVATDGLRWPGLDTPGALPFLGLTVQLQAKTEQLPEARALYGKLRATMAKFGVPDTALGALGLSPWRRHLER
jgi:O-antigen ligase